MEMVEISAESILTSQRTAPQLPKNDPSTDHSKTKDSSIEQDLFEFKRSLLGLIKDEYSHVILTNKLKSHKDKDPYYQIIIKKDKLEILDFLENVVKTKITYIWNSQILTVDNKSEDMSALKPYMDQMMTDMNNDRLELFYAN